MAFYTNVDQVGNRILHRFINDDGEHVSEWADFKPTLYTKSNNGSEFKSIDGSPVMPMVFDGIKEARDELKVLSGISNSSVMGDIKWTSLFINDRYFDDIKFDISKLKIVNIDIETDMINFKVDDWSDKALKTITISYSGKYTAFGYKNFTGNLPPNSEYVHCDNEDDLIIKFLKMWGEIEPNIVTGWNCKEFDIKFLVQRIRARFGEATANRLSPTAAKFTKKCINERLFDGKTEYTLVGIETLDLMQVYKKFTFKNQESYSLNYIAHVELGEEKIHYDGNLDDLYENDFNKYIVYNIKDVELVDRIDDARNLMLLVMTLGYMSHIKLEDTFFQLRMWDSIIYNRLLRDKVVVPGNAQSSKTEKYQGAFVNEPVLGFHSWAVSFDLNSLYPKIIEGMNISPEKQITMQVLDNLQNRVVGDQLDALNYMSERIVDNKLPVNIDDLVAGDIPIELTNALRTLNWGLTANGCLWDNNGMGFLGSIMSEQYSQRKAVKQEMLTHSRNAELIKTILKERLIDKTT